MIATFIGKLFEPMSVLAILSILGGLHAGLMGTALTYYIAFVFVLMILPVILVRIWLVRTKKVDWDIRDRKKRTIPLLLQLGMLLVDIRIVGLWGNSELSKLFIIFFVWLLGFFLVTMFWKMSGHVSTIALATGLIVTWYGWGWWPILLFVPLVGWSRIMTRNHTLAQSMVGAIYAWGVLFFV